MPPVAGVYSTVTQPTAWAAGLPKVGAPGRLARAMAKRHGSVPVWLLQGKAS